MKNRTVFFVAVILILVIILIITGSWRALESVSLIETERATLRDQGTLIFDNAREFEISSLEDHRGHPVNSDMFTGNWTLIYFCLIACPDVCPSTLYTLDQLKTSLSKNNKILADNLKVMIITVDPARDSRQKLSNYIPYFNDKFIGVTGNQSAISKFARSLHVSYMPPPKNTSGDYFVQHSSNIILINPDGQYQGFIRPPFEVDKMAKNMVLINEIY